MSKYTLELRYMYEDKNFKLFDFPYNLYDNDLKPWFQEKFFVTIHFYYSPFLDLTFDFLLLLHLN